MPDTRRMIVPPYVGEFGWELMNWQAHVRRVVCESNAVEVTLAIPTGHDPLYADLIAMPRVRLVSVSVSEIPGRPSEDHRIDSNGNRIAANAIKQAILAALSETSIDLRDARIVWPDFRGSLIPTRLPSQQFIHLGTRQSSVLDILLVPRTLGSSSERNHSADWWDELAAALRNRALRVGIYAPPLANAITQLNYARLAAGGSTGGLHLASLCGCPHVVWGPGPDERWTAIQMTNRQRYETIWNPLATPVQYHELGWQPSIEDAARVILAGLDSIAIGATRAAATTLRKLQWRAKRGLAGLWARNSANGRTPWRVRELLRQATR